MNLDRLKLVAHVIATNPEAEAKDDLLITYFKSFVRLLFDEDLTDSKDPSEAFQLSLKCLTNLCWSSHRNELLQKAIGSDRQCAKFVALLKTVLFQKAYCSVHPVVIGLLCNLTRDPQWASRFFIDDHDKWIQTVFPSDTILSDTIPLLLNMTINQDVRRQLCANELFQTALLTQFSSTLISNTEQSLLLAGIIKNCCFEDEYHPQLLGPDSQLLETLLQPLCGPEDIIDAEDKRTFPVSLQRLVGNPSTIRSDSNELKTVICHALLQLCATGWGRTRLRSAGTYFILRELHKYEGSKLENGASSDADIIATKSLLFDIEQVVDQLLCEERDRDKTTIDKSLRAIEVDADTAAKLERDRMEFIGTS